MRRYLTFVGVLILSAAGPAAARAADNVAMVTELRGGAHANGAPVALLAEFPEGAEFGLADGAGVTVVYLSSGREFAFTGPASIAIGPDKADALSGAPARTRSFLASGENDVRIAPAKTAQAAVVMRASGLAGADIGLISPIGNILQIHPDFTWEAAGGNASYRLSVLDQNGTEYFSIVTYQTKIHLPDEIELPIGARLTWELEANLGARTLFAAADFEVLDGAWRRAVERAKPDSGADFSNRVFYARLLESAGLLEDAAAAWRALHEERPDDPVLRAAAGG
jgi:hypothetical protein